MLCCEGKASLFSRARISVKAGVLPRDKTFDRARAETQEGKVAASFEPLGRSAQWSVSKGMPIFYGSLGSFRSTIELRPHFKDLSRYRF
jgi:hypothetical protein